MPQIPSFLASSRRTATRLSAGVAVSAAVLAFASAPAHATLRTFDLLWSGASYGNTASATGVIVIDDTLLPNPSFGYYFTNPGGIGIQSLSVTITGASSGNGTFTLPDFAFVAWDTNGVALDLTQDLVGQPTAGAPWGTSDYNNPDIGGDFNLFGGTPYGTTPGAPAGTWYFELTTNEFLGDKMLLTSFAPRAISSVPEPGVIAFGVLAGGSVLGLIARKRKA